MTTCPECGATIPADAAGGRCWLCAYSIQSSDLTRSQKRPESPYETFFQSTYYLILVFVGLIGLGQVPAALARGGDALVGLIVYVVIALVVLLAAHARAEQRIIRGQDTGYRARLYSLLRSAAVTFIVLVLVVVALIFALFVACMVAVSGEVF